MSITSKVKVLHSGMTGAPASTSAAGSIVGILDACLVDGFGLVNATSVVTAGGVTTFNFAAGHSASEQRVIEVAGATPAGLNGQWRVSSTTVNTIVVATPGIPDGPASGTISVKMASLGWTREFTGANLRVYRSANGASTQFYMRVDDTASNTARVTGYETMTDVNTGTNPFPSNSQVSGGGLWPHRSSRWFLVGDDVRFYFGAASSSTNGHSIEFFGDIVSYKPANAYRCGVFSALADPLGVSAATGYDLSIWDATGISGYMARSPSGIGGSSLTYRMASPWFSGTTTWSGSSAFSAIPYPDPVTNSLRLSNAYLLDVPLRGLAGYLPGIYPLSQAIGAAQGNLSTIPGQGDLEGRELMFFETGPGSGSFSPRGAVCFDVTGPWAY